MSSVKRLGPEFTEDKAFQTFLIAHLVDCVSLVKGKENKDTCYLHLTNLTAQDKNKT